MSKWAGGGPAAGEPFAWEEAAQAIERLARGAALVTSELDFSRVIEEIVAQTVRLGARSAGLYLADDERREIRFASQLGIPDEVIDKARVVPYDAPLLIARCAATRQLQVLEDVEELPPENVFARRSLALIGSRSSCAAPLVAHGQLIAVLSWSFVEPRRFSPLERAAIEAVADVFAVGLANARTHEREQRLRRTMEAIREAMLAISEEVELKRVLTLITEHACAIAGARQGVVCLMGAGPEEQPTGVKDRAAGDGSVPPDGPSSAAQLPTIAREPRSFRTGRAADGAWRCAMPGGVPPEAPVLVVPIFHRNDMLAAICLTGKKGEEAFSEDDQHAVEQLAQYAGIAIEHASLQEQLQRELRERRQAEETLALAQQIAHLGNWEWDVDSGRLRWSDEIYRILGAQPRAFEATLETFLASVHPEDRSRVRDAALATIHGQQPFHLEHRIVRLDGSERLVEEQGEVLRDEHGRPLRMIGTVLDITDRKRIEAALRESEERFRLAIDNAPIGMALIGPQGRFLQVNRVLCELLGYSPEELVQLGFQDVTHPEDVAADLALIDQLWAGALPRYQLTRRYRRKSGELIKVLLHAAVVRDATGRAVYGVAQIEDITARERAQEEHERLLAEVASERRLLRTVIDSSPTGIALVAPGGRWILANPQATRLLGEPRIPGAPMLATRLLRSDGALLPDEELPSIRTLRGECLAGEEYLLERQGKYTPIRVRTAPVRDPDGKLMAAVLVLEDLTTAKEFERMREEWTSVVAHDLRQPVTIITLYADTLVRSADPTDQIKLRHILTSAARLRRMISDLLDSSLIEAHRLKLHRELVDVGRLVTQVAERSAMEDTAPIRTVLHGSLPRLEVDPLRFEQVLANLLSNARKYGYPGTEVLVEVEPKGDEVEVAVLNHGDQIPPEVLPYLFYRFHRARQTREKGVGGLGLGLYITRGLIEAHGGRIWAESPPGGLTAFRLRLPLPSATSRDG